MIYTHYEGWLPEKTPTDVWKDAWLGKTTTTPWAHDATPYPIIQLPSGIAQLCAAASDGSVCTYLSSLPYLKCDLPKVMRIPPYLKCNLKCMYTRTKNTVCEVGW